MNTNTSPQVCFDVLTYGACTKGEDCGVCNCPREQNISCMLKLNAGARAYVPKAKKKEATQDIASSSDTAQEAKLNFNLNANEYVPKFATGKGKSTTPTPTPSLMYYNQAQNFSCQDKDKDQDLPEGNELDMIMNDIIENEALEELEQDDDESDVDKWFPKYKDCECCKGFVYKCQGIACSNMAVCYCKMKAECDEEEEEEEGV